MENTTILKFFDRRDLSFMKKTYFVLVALAVMLSFSACGSKNNNNIPPAASSPVASSPGASAPASSPAPAAGATKSVTINASNWKFDQTEITANVGDTINLTLKNTDGAHGLAIEDLGVNIKNNQTAEIKLDKAGTFEYHCSVQCGQGHDNMTGVIVVQ